MPATLSKQDQAIKIAFKKAHSHLANVIKMLEDDAYCIDIMQQNLSVIGLLKAANARIYQRHLDTCFAKAMQGSSDNLKKKMIDELLKINTLSTK